MESWSRAGWERRGERKQCAINHKGGIKNETELKEIAINKNNDDKSKYIEKEFNHCRLSTKGRNTTLWNTSKVTLAEYSRSYPG